MRITGVEAAIAHYREAGTKKVTHNRNCAQMGSGAHNSGFYCTAVWPTLWTRQRQTSGFMLFMSLLKS